jgi:AcrR family transcriptional regulator
LTQTPLKPRRRPVQSRAKATQAAILDAFVRLLVERGYARLGMREIATLAGVGLGTLYEHFPGKASIAANCIRSRFKSVGLQMRERIEAGRGQPLAQLVDAVLDDVVAMHAERTQEWSALIFLERQISGLAAYRALYEEFVDIWTGLLQAGGAGAEDGGLRETAYALHATVYGFLYQTLMCRPQQIGTPLFRQQLGRLVHGYLAAVKRSE